MNQSSFNELFLSQRKILLRMLQRMVGNVFAAEDLLHDTYLRVTRALAERSIEHLAPFLYQTARNLALDHLRAQRLQSRTMIEDVPLDVLRNVTQSQSSAEDAAHAQRLLERLNTCLTELSTRQQKIFSLNRLQGCSYPEIAAQLDVSTSTVQKELKLIKAICNGVVFQHEL
ncbi:MULTISPECIES: sigma-70 family RNA polymerase sigma factor [unclassified Pseudomonas]|uniref:RNA polymerase sigma factor n=1 Tax=unclassified Pseudomonas TaxID=196821 RepID=UPI002B22DE4A|nr:MULTISPECIES: sigma-70 family RNA polymerase sigma factor [unclassified Pseudomonas]MEA9977713.1 sigma-70 family RNA polymerase sigma factor [Pseudomonas sp. RTS4]MEB0199144.1 sigma-70 family RNA polymerase sigma factor [Pseudomonas sp. 5S4]MEB0246576.1 sigma-70 family RNA polymerase sigma factor [Pseudomonas sp. 10S5]